MSDAEGRATVLVVEGDPATLDTYTQWLEHEYDVRTASDADQAFDQLDRDVDVVLLDRRLPEHPASEVIERIRSSSYHPQVALLSAIEPDVELLEMGFDDYLRKPTTRETLRETVADLAEREDYSDRMREYSALASKRAALEAAQSEDRLAESEGYQELCDRITDLGEELEDDVRHQLLDDAGLVGTLREVAGEGEEGHGAVTPSDADIEVEVEVEGDVEIVDVGSEARSESEAEAEAESEAESTSTTDRDGENGR